jgi:hypothetical protein
MKKLCVFLVVIIAATGLCAQTLVRAEYFVDTDPGPGNGIGVSVDAINTIQQFITPGLFSEGVHLVGIRTQSNNGFWSVTNFRSFIVDEPDNGIQTTHEIISAEYFIDTDPGPGNGIELPIDTGFSINETLLTDMVSLGVHRIGLRTQSSNGIWSIPNFRSFIVQLNEEGVTESYEIVAAEYFTDIDPGPGLGIPIPISPSDSISLDETINQLGEQLGLHYVSLRFKSSNGFWSATAHHDYTICTSYGPLASFTHTQNGYQMLYSSESLYADSIEWLFHDGELSNSAFPSKIYIPGEYPVRLRAFNECGISTFQDTIFLKGISELSPLTGCNLGTVSMYLYGAGFDTTTTFRLNGPDVIDGENITFNETKTLAIVQFNLLDRPIGEYSIEVGFEGISLYTHPQPFVVSDSLVGGISYVWNPQPRLRVGRARAFRLTITNSSNMDITSIPFMMLFPANAILGEQFDIVNVTLDGVEDTTSAYFVTLDSTAGEFANIKVFNGMCPILPASRSITYAVDVTIMTQGEFITHGFIYNLNSESPLPLGQSILENQVRSNRSGPCDGQPECWSSIANAIIDGLSAIPGAVGPFVACASGIAQAVATFACASSGPMSQSQANLQAVSIGTSLGVTVANCLLSVAILSTPAYAAQLALLYTLRQAVNFINTTGTVVQTSVSIQSDLTEPSDPCFGPPAPPPFPPVIVTDSFDPNEIVGINEGSFYTNETNLAYSVFFENDSSASASAVEVHVYDTLNVNHFDFSSFQLGDIYFGSHHIEVPLGLQRFSTNYDLGDGYLVRIDAALDSVTGIVDWHFITLDTLTLDFPDDVFYGFLPPNNTTGVGQAEARYTVSRKSSLLHGQSFSNRASIFFDFNAPIVTNNWVNTLDLIAPASHVLQIEPTDSSSFLLTCQGTDEGVGISYYTLFVSVNNGQFLELRSNANSGGQFLLQGTYGDTYSFYCIATDSCGNAEFKEPVAELTYTPWPEQIVASASIVDVLCPEDATGSISLNLVGGDGAYTISWSNGATDTQLSNLSAGDYSVTVEDGIGNIFQSTYSIESTPAIIVNPVVIPAVCFGESGSASLDISGGTPPYDVVWGGQDPNTLPAGEYFYSVVDQNHCVFESSVVITAPSALMVESSVVADSNAICTGSITLMVIGGVAPYSFEWSHDATLNSSSAQNLCEGNYNVTVTDANGCEVVNENLLVLIGIGMELTKPSHWVLSPNPTKGQLLLTCGGNEQIDYVDLYDAEGSLIKHACSVQNTIDAGTFRLDLSNYPNGIYTIQINTSTRRETQKVVLSKD